MKLTRTTLGLVGAVALTVAPQAASAQGAGSVIHQKQIQGAPGSADRYQEVESWLTTTAYHEVRRDLAKGGALRSEYLVDTRANVDLEYNVHESLRRGRHGLRCNPRQALAARRAISSTYPRLVRDGKYTVVARRVEFGRRVLDLTGDIGEPDVGPQRVDVTIDEGTGVPLHLATGRGGRVHTTEFSVEPVTAATRAALRLSPTAAAALRVSPAAVAAPSRTVRCL
jgi:hypothetical protein